jgi:hypothetical protein
MFLSIIGNQLEAMDCVLAERVVEHVLTCFRSRDPVISLDQVVLGPVAGTKEAASSGVHEAAKIVATWFKHLLDDS